jgi:hypothetical protein
MGEKSGHVSGILSRKFYILDDMEKRNRNILRF